MECKHEELGKNDHCDIPGPNCDCMCCSCVCPACLNIRNTA